MAAGSSQSARQRSSRRNSLALLGAILAGGRSSRFGSDKALHLHRGMPLISHVMSVLQSECAEVVICGRNWGSFPMLQDRPGPGLGPIAGLCAALHHAAAHGFDAVLSAPCDLLDIPSDIAARLAPAPAVADNQWLLGLWPSAGAALLEQLLLDEGAISARRWIEVADAERRCIPLMRNVNRPGDL